MRKVLLLFAAIGITTFVGCTGPEGPQGPAGSNINAEVFELRNVNFTLDNNNEYTIYRTLDPVIFDSDNILIYRMTGTIDSNTPVWQSIPRTLFLDQGELDYDYDFSLEDFKIYAGGTYNLATTPDYLNNQTFRIVILPGYFSNKNKAAADINDYNAVAKAYGITEGDVQEIQ
ncbi:MAG: hypothetical protein EOO48_04585 [Flavobacterium sp.]|nr:MAG: hypothetical protein EOO48_04585 [Flavobacterium sp.]